MKKTYQYLLFDMDNTLLDFTKAEYLSFRDTCSACDVSCSEELYRQYSAINDRLWKMLEKKQISQDSLKVERFRQLLVSIDYADDEITAEKAMEMRDVYIDNLKKQTCLVDGAEDICRKLAKKYRMYIVTNGLSRTSRPRFEQSALKPYFDDLFISEEIGAGKPSAEYYDHVLRKIGCTDKTAYLAIGDSLTSDCTGAVAYGLDICYFNPTNRPANGLNLTYTIEKLSELETILL